jgi:hypothetical protein
MRDDQVFKGPALDIILDECIEDIRARRSSVRASVAKYRGAPELASLLETANAIRQVPVVLPSSRFKRATRDLLLGRTKYQRPSLLARLPGLERPWLVRFLAAVLGLAAAFVVATGVVFATNQSVPGTTLYPVKRGSERIQLLLVQDADIAGQLHASFAERRLAEALALARAGQIDLADTAVEEYGTEVDAALYDLKSRPQGELSSVGRRFEERLVRTYAELQKRQLEMPAESVEPIRHAITWTEKAIRELSLVPSASD